MTVRELIRQSEALLDDKDKDCNVAKVLFYHLADKEPHQLYLMMDEEVDEQLYQDFQAGMKRYLAGEPIQYIKGKETFFSRDFIEMCIRDSMCTPFKFFYQIDDDI